MFPTRSHSRPAQGGIAGEPAEEQPRPDAASKLLGMRDDRSVGKLCSPRSRQGAARMTTTHRGFTARIGDGDLRLLRIFCTVAERGGFSSAESELQMGLPAISRAIKDL